MSELVFQLNELDFNVKIYDPISQENKNYDSFSKPIYSEFDLVLIAVPHTIFNGEKESLVKFHDDGGMIIDLYAKIVPDVSDFQL